MKPGHLSTLALAACACALLAGCAEERAPINRVQPNALSKSFFVGDDLADTSNAPQFYWRAYVIDASVSQSLAGVGSWAGVDRIRWEITESNLIARKAYPIADGQDDKGQTDQKPDGTVVASYKITSHFDVKRDYNPSTGEELNVLVENTTDRPWYQREYMRVDWSTDLVQDPMWFDMFYGKVFGNITILPQSYEVTDPSSEDAPYFETDAGYFDITEKYYLAPDQAASPFSDATGKYPTCLMSGLFTGSATYECDAQEATVRHSYWKVDPGHDFEPLENTKAPEDIVGNPGGGGNSFTVGMLTPGRQGWDPAYGYTDKLFHRFAHIHNIWQQSHAKKSDGTLYACTANDDADGNGTADQCEAVNADDASLAKGSQCDTLTGACTLPYRSRTVKPFGYWVNKETPLDLLDPLDASGAPTGERGVEEDMIYSWNQLLMNAVGYAREVECRRTGDGDRDACHSQYFQADQWMLSMGAWLVDQPQDKTTVLTLCHNPVRDYDDHATCGATGLAARAGDIRKNWIYYWPYDSRAHWGGIADWNADPLTGEILGGAAEIMGRSATYAAGMQRDVLQVAMGDMTVDDVITGVPADRYAHMLQNGRTDLPLTTDELTRRQNAIDADQLRASVAFKPMTGTLADGEQARVALQISSTQDLTEQSSAQLEFEALANKVRGSRYEADLVDSHWLVNALGLSPTLSVDDQVMEVVSPLRGLDPGRERIWQVQAAEALRARGICFMDSEAPAAGSVYLGSLGKYFKEKYAGLSVDERGKAMYDELWKEAVKGIGIHEIGHSLGMYHNFSSSWDAPNYQPQYWQLRTNEGQASADCQGTPRTGSADTCMGPRYLDPETLDEQGYDTESRPGIEYFANTSVMEYQLERFGETVGLGAYDQEHILATYGRVLETLDDRVLGHDDQQSLAPRLTSQLGEQDRITRLLTPASVFGTQPSPWPAHYTTTARFMKTFDPARDCRAATDAEKALGKWRIVHGKVCAQTPRDHAAWLDFEDGIAPKAFANEPLVAWHTKGDWTKGGDRVRWFYRVGQAHNAYLHSNSSDAGADPYEVTMNTVHSFDAMYPWSYFRRQNREFEYAQVPARALDRYIDRVRAYHWVVANGNAFYGAMGTGLLETLSSMDDWNRPYVVAETEMFNLLNRIELMPQPGAYTLNLRYDQAVPYYDLGTSSRGTSAFTLGIVDSRYVDEQFDSSPSGGGSWDYLHWMDHAGFYTEKFLATSALADSRPTLFTISRQNYLDDRAVKINFRTDMPQAVDRLLGGILAEDWETVGMYVQPDANQPDAQPEPKLPDLTAATCESARPADSLVLFGNLGYRQQLATMLNAGIFSRMNDDMQLMNKMRIWIDGQVGQLSLPDDQQVRFTDPASGYTYVARRYGTENINGKLVDRGIGSRMLDYANQQLIAAYQVDANTDGTLVLDKYGAPHLTLDSGGQPLVYDEYLAGTLQRYVGVIDAQRQIGAMLGFGPLDGSSSP